MLLCPTKPHLAPSAILVVWISVSLVDMACDLTPDDRWVWMDTPVPFYVAEASLEEESVDVPLDQPITVRFSNYLDPESFEYFNALVIESGGIRARGFSRYQLWDRSLTFFPTTNLIPNLTYTLTVNPDTVRAINGDELVIPFELTFRSAAEETVEQERNVPRLSYATDVAPIFSAHCSCHDGSDARIPLDYDPLLSASSQSMPARPLVRPYSPTSSYLIEKILPDYPDRRWSVMPPPYADDEPLDETQIQIIEQWIATGAMP